MTIGNTPKRAKRAYAAPRRRFRSDDDAGYLGDAPILLNLPNLCGVPDLEEGDETESSYRHDAMESASLLSGMSTTPDPEPAAANDHASPPAAEEPPKSAEPTELAENHDDTAGEPKLAAPEFVTSGARDQDDDPQASADHEDDDYDEDRFEDEDYHDEAAPRPSIHRKIITWTAIFVAVASLYMYMNRDQAQPVVTPSDQPDVELGWEDDPFTDESFGTEAPILEPSYGEQFDVPIDQGATPAPSSDVNTDTTAAPVGARLPGAAEATVDDFQIQRVRSRGQDSGYPETTTPDAAYEVTNNPTDLRTSMRPDAGPTSSLDGISPMTPTAGAANDQPY